MPAQPKSFTVSRARILALMFVLFASTMWTTRAHSQVDSNSCGSLANHYGPLDYRTQRDSLKVVETWHFTPQVEALIGGKSGPIYADIHYTLMTSPNHHRALIAMTRLAEKMKSPVIGNGAYSVDCYYDRAIRFKPDDTIVRVLFSQYLHKHGRDNEATQHLDVATSYAKDNAFSHYNIGLAYFDLGQFEKALAEAHRATTLGFDRTELTDRLKGANKWHEPTE